MSNLVGKPDTEKQKIQRLETKVAGLQREINALISRLQSLERKVHGGEVPKSNAGGTEKHVTGADDNCVVS